MGDRHHDYSVFARKIVKAHQAAVQGHGLGFDANVAASDASVAQETPGNELRGIDFDRKT